nr:integrase, catalytic region, zinc finger, CCHC-type, peptidase aspartic, catalytic [Tanacetum cinerariifolium]
GQDNVVDEDVDEQPVQDLALNVDNMFQANYCDAFDSDVDETPTVQTMFMENLSFNNVVDKSLIAKLATYKEQVELYERRAKFKLTEREQKIDEQLRIVITDRNIKKEILKKELHSVKMKPTSTINHNKSMMGTFWETLAEGNQGALHLGLERPRVYFDLSPEEKE